MSDGKESMADDLEKEKNAPQPDVKQDTQPKQIPQRFPFVQVPNELARTYVMENGERLSIPNVAAYSEMSDGGHRVISHNNGGQVAFTIPPKWIWIEHVSKQGIYVFS